MNQTPEQEAREVIDNMLDRAYVEGDINFGKTAEMLNLHPVQWRDLFLSRGIPIKIGVSSDEESRAEGSSAGKIRDKA
ncbi:MAG: UPF0175 family protein [Desulfobacterota bacterium]|jgi:predicted HTH domain antitoxin|nr:UPF0175 family protein [Thermodesulfobacteriota bacterium]